MFPLGCLYTLKGQNMVSPQSSLLHVKKHQLPELFLIEEVLHFSDNFHSPPLGSLQYILFFLYSGSQSRMQHSRCNLTTADQKGKIPFPNLLGTLHLVHLAFRSASAQWQFMSNFSSNSIPRLLLSAWLLLIPPSPSLY